MPRQIQGSQTDFSFGEVDVALKRRDEHPARKGGLRQMRNARILNAGGVQNRPGRRALFPLVNGIARVEEFTISAGNTFKIAFGDHGMQIINSAGVAVAIFTHQGGGGGLLPWPTAYCGIINYALLGMSIFITFPGMRPQVVTWDGAATWTIADYTEMVVGNQKRTPFYRISPQGITLLPSAQTGDITIEASAPLFNIFWVGTRIRYVGRQIQITGLIDATHVSANVREALPGSQIINFNPTDPALIYNIGDEVIGSVSGSKGIITSITGGNIFVQLLSTQTSQIVATSGLSSIAAGTVATLAFVTADYVAGPGGTLRPFSVSDVGVPRAVTIWDDEIFNGYRGYPASVFVDQFRLGFCDFQGVPGGIAWSAINSPYDLYVGSAPRDAMFEIAPDKVRVRYVVPGPESSEFVFCDNRIYYIPISATNPLKPGSVDFRILSGDGAAPVQPRISQEAILYVNAGQNSVMAIVASGAYQRPFNTRNLSDFHGHLFNAIQCIAVPSADGTFNERYAYVLNADGSIAVGKYSLESLQTSLPVIGWGPWTGVGVVSWIAALGADVLFTSIYFGSGVAEILDDAQYLDCAVPVNAAPAAFAPPSGKGPLWFIPSQTVTLIDQGTRTMGTYAIDADGFIVPQFNGGEDLTVASLVAGQPWTETIEPFTPAAQSGADMHQRMELRQIAKIAVYVINSTGFLFQSLFSAKQTKTSASPGTPMQERRVQAWNVDDDSTKPPTWRETVEGWTPTGSSFDPRVAIVKDTPGPLLIAEIAMEITT